MVEAWHMMCIAHPSTSTQHPSQTSGPVMYREFSAQTIPAEQRLAYWTRVTEALIFPVEIELREPQRFTGTARCWQLGSVALINLRSDAVRYVRRRPHLRGETGEHILISFSGHSEIGFHQGGHDLVCRGNQFFIEKTDSTSEFVQFHANDVWTLKLPVASLHRHLRSIEPFYMSLFNADAGVGGLFLDLIQRIPLRYPTTSSLAAEGLGQSLIEFAALAIQSDARVLSSSNSSVQRAHLARAERFIRRNLRDRRLSPQTVAEACNISVRYLHAIFHETGTPVGEWIRSLRLESARAQVCEAHRAETLGEIAYRWGFTDQAQFSRHFKARFGRSAKELRAEARSAVSSFN